MKLKLSFCLLILISFLSCKDDTKINQVEILKASKQKNLVFTNINNAWSFSPRNLSPESQAITTNWNEWRLFTSELNQKPKGTIGAFQRKTKSLVQKAAVLSNTIPAKLNKPQIKSRIMAMVTKVKALHTFINLNRIPEQKVLLLISDLNIEVIGIQDQIEEIVRRGNIQLEEGESEMLNSLKGVKEVLPMKNDINSIENQQYK
ncbi:hypothetical protein [Flavobacterium sp.]|uniref:hypothetical protein n=1 Tax=Flavobacterium sp. TaxID=239 RepID=UPI00286D8E9C|nr:hypothetical protein [Flavobacterium sp.]